MANPIIYNQWDAFINHPEYSKYFEDNMSLWNTNFRNLIEYLNNNKKRPPNDDDDQFVSQLGLWITRQKRIYSKREEIMKDEIIYNTWTDFKNNPIYAIYLEDNFAGWRRNLLEVKSYIDINLDRPKKNDKDSKNIKLFNWINTQFKNYKTKKAIMKYSEIQQEWIDFITSSQYKKYFQYNT